MPEVASISALARLLSFFILFYLDLEGQRRLLECMNVVVG
jgi:hypothetical protein